MSKYHQARTYTHSITVGILIMQDNQQTPRTIIQAVRGLNNHLDDIYQAVKHQNGLLNLNDDKEATIRAMKKSGLIYVADVIDGYMVYGAVARFIKHFDEKGRFNQTSDDVAKVLNKIEQAIELHRIIKRKGGDEYSQEVIENVWELSDILMSICYQFSVQVYEKMASINDIEARIRFNELQLKELKRLNDIFSGQLTNERLNELGLFYDEFLTITKNLLLPILDKCRREMVNASAKLNSELLKFKKELKYKSVNELIGVWRQHFRQCPNWQVDDGLLITAPPCFFKTKMSLVAYANWQDLGVDNYIELAQKFALKPPTNVQDKTQPIVVEMINEQIEEILSPEFERMLWFFECVEVYQKPLDARSAFYQLGVGEHMAMDDWLSMIANYYFAYQYDFSVPLTITFDGEPLSNYDGTQLVYNLTVSCE